MAFGAYSPLQSMIESEPLQSGILHSALQTIGTVVANATDHFPLAAWNEQQLCLAEDQLG
jgi:hypothetical protein